MVLLEESPLPKIRRRLAFADTSSHPYGMSIIELEAEALKLAPEDQARLLRRLAKALDAVEESELTNEDLEKRWADFENSNAQGIEASELRARASRRYGLS